MALDIVKIWVACSKLKGHKNVFPHLARHAVYVYFLERHMYAEVKGTTLLLRYLLRPEVRNRTISHCVDTSLKVASTSGHEKSDSSVNTDKVLNKTQRWIWIKR